MHIFFWLLIFSPVVLVLAWIFTFGRDGDFGRQFFSLFGTVVLTTLAVVMVVFTALSAKVFRWE